MKQSYFRMHLSRLLIALLFLFALIGPPSALAQDGEPPHSGMAYDPFSGQWYDASSTQPPAPDEQGTAASGGTDTYYGYSWNTAAYHWLEASDGGTMAPLTSDSGDITSAIYLPFAFKFFENTYTKLYITKYGYLTFTDNASTSSQSHLPSGYYPNNVIAPYWTILHASSGGTAGHVYYKSYGSTPGSRSFAIQWNQMKGGFYDGDRTGGDDLYNFEAILYENGDIAFQYKQMNYVGNIWWCGYAGIEDSRGTDGLSSFSVCSLDLKLSGGTAVRYSRPTALARVLIDPTSYGIFTTPGSRSTFSIPVKNTGDLGADTFDLTASCLPSASVDLADSASGILLTDTNGSGLPDTGSLDQGAAKTILATITMPPYGNPGDSVLCSLTAIPARDSSRKRSASLSAAIPASFTQVYRDDVNYTMRFATIKQGKQAEYPVSAPQTLGSASAVAEAPNGNIVTAWTVRRCDDSACDSNYREIYYAINRPTGEAVKAATRLTDLNYYAYWGYDENPAIAVAPDGNIGIVFSRYLEDEDYTYNMNIRLARLTASGTLLGITNVTNSYDYDTWPSVDSMDVLEPAIAATGDNQFTVAWQSYYRLSENSAYSVKDIWTAIYTSSGSLTQAKTKRTADTSSDIDGFLSASLAAIDGNRSVLAYINHANQDVMYQVITSGGTLEKAATFLTTDGTHVYDDKPDVARLSSGNILFAWEQGDKVAYAVLDSAYHLAGTIKTLDNLSLHPYGVSATSDGAGHGIITWIDNDSTRNPKIFYAVVSSAGQTLTNTMVMKRTPASYWIGWTNNNNTTFTLPSSTSNTDLTIRGATKVVIASGRTGDLHFSFDNLGLTPASTIKITATKSPELSFGSVAGAACSGDTCTWALTGANLGFMGGGQLVLPVSMPVSAAGTAYQVAFHISSPETDDVTANNDLEVEVLAGTPLYVPLIRK